MYLSELERKTAQLKRYGCTTAVISFLLSGLALGALLYAFCNFNQTPAVAEVVKNWNLQPIVDIQAVKEDEACPGDFEVMLNTTWPGTQTLCLCYPESGETAYTPGKCAKETDNCQTVEGLRPIPMQILYNKRYCIKRLDPAIEFLKFPSVNATTKECPDDHRLCGDETTICFPNDVVCPINEIHLQSKSRLLQNEAPPAATNSTETPAATNSTDTTESPATNSTEPAATNSTSQESSDPNRKIDIKFEFNSVLNFIANNQGAGYPIVQFSWGYSQMCVDPSFYSIEKYDASTNTTTKRTDVFNFTNFDKLGCPATGFGRYDNRWGSLTSYAESGVYTDNKIFEALETVPGYQTQETPNDYSQPMHSVFYRSYIDWKPECATDPLRGTARLGEESSSMKEIQEELFILVIMAAAVFAVVGLLYPLLTCCCQCCGPSTLNSYKLFLASKGVASFLLVGGFTGALFFFIQKPYKFNSNFKGADCSDSLTNAMIHSSDKSVDNTFNMEAVSFISLGVLLMIELVMAGFYCCVQK